MHYDKWRFCLTKNDFYYFRHCKERSLVKVYPMFSMSILDGPTGIISWISEIDGNIVSFGNKLQAIFYTDIELYKMNNTVKIPFFVYSIDDNIIIEKMRKNYINIKRLRKQRK